MTVKPVRKLTIYVLNHSHTDIGFTDLQPEIEKKQVENLLQGIAIAKATSGNQPGSRFVWNVEVGWAADLYQRRLTPPQRAEYDEAVGRRLGVAPGSVSEHAHRPVPSRRTPAHLPFRRHRIPALGGEDRRGDDQRCARLHLGHGERAGPGRHTVFLGGAELFRPDRRHPGAVGEQALLVGSRNRAAIACWCGYPGKAMPCPMWRVASIRL